MSLGGTIEQLHLRMSRINPVVAGAVIAVLAVVIAVAFSFERFSTAYTHNLEPFKSSAALLLLLALLMLATRPLTLQALARTRWTVMVTLVAAALVTASLLTRFLILHSFMTDDEFVYAFQAQTYLAGRVWNPAPPLGDVLTPHFVGLAAGKWFGMYPPGWPMVLALFEALGLPAEAAIVVLIVAAVALLAALVRGKGDAALAILAVAAFAAAPFTIFNGGALYSHFACAVFILLAALATDRALASRSLLWAVIGGAALGMVGVSRNLSAIAVGAPIGIALLLSPHRIKLIAGFALGCAPFGVALLWYQKALTGSPFKSPYWLAGRTVDHLYFDPPSVLKGLRLSVERLMELSFWTSPVLLLLLGGALLIKARARKLGFIDFIFPAAVIAYIFYPMSPVYQYGPRYLFEFWPLALVTIVSGFALATAQWQAYARALLLISCAYGIVLWPFVGREYHRFSHQNLAMEDQINAKGLDRAVICIRGDSNIERSRPSESLARNDINASGSILEARCDLTTPAALAAAFPDRSIWTYDANDRLTLASPPRAATISAPAPRPIDEAVAENGIVARLAGWIVDVISKAGYAGVTLLMAIESACIPLPSEIIMPFAGYLVSIGRLNLLEVSIAGAIGCNLGSIVAYAAGRYGGRPLIQRWGKWLLISERDLERADAFFARYGSGAVFFGRLLPVIRTFIAFPAGVVRMNMLRFHIYTFLGSWPWCLALAWIGMKLGNAWNSDPRLKHALHGLDAIIILLVLAAVGFYIWHHLRGRKPALHKQPDPLHESERASG